MNYPGKKSYTLTEARTRLERYCAYQERCHQEVRRKLESMGMIPEAADQIITDLIKSDFLNEERFARAYARGKFRTKNWGRNRITMELKRRQISAFNIKAAMEELNEDDYHGKFHEIADKKIAQLQGEGLLKKKRKLADYLLYRGWESDLVYEKVRELQV